MAESYWESITAILKIQWLLYVLKKSALKIIFVITIHKSKSHRVVRLVRCMF